MAQTAHDSILRRDAKTSKIAPFVFTRLRTALVAARTHQTVQFHMVTQFFVPFFPQEMKQPAHFQ